VPGSGASAVGSFSGTSSRVSPSTRS